MNDLQNLAKQLKALAKDTPDRGPQTNEELHTWIEDNLGMSIPTTPVCEGHCAPFDFVADIYFERTSSALAMANRGGGKTENSAILHLLNSLFRPGCESGTVGALLLQANRAYDVFKQIVRLHGKVGNENDHPEIKKSIQDETEFNNQSSLQIIPGCLPAQTKIITKDGPINISKIVNQKLPVEVKSYNFEKREWQWKKVINWKHAEPNQKWIRVKWEFPGTGSNHFTATSGHEMPDIDGNKVTLGSLFVGDHISVPGWIPSEQQEQIIMGLMLGDGSISKGNSNRLRVSHADYQKDYLRWISGALSECRPYEYRREAKKTYDVDFCTQRRFKELRQEWYPYEIKRIPDTIWANLNELGLAVWMMDDGCFARRPNGEFGNWGIATMNMNKDERDMATIFFEGIGVQCSWICANKEKDQWNIYFDQESSFALQLLVNNYIDISERKEKGWKQWKNPEIQHGVEGLYAARIISKEEVEINSDRYDIVVEGNSNYLTASGVLVGNTIAAVNGPHWQKFHTDEVDLMDVKVFQESRQIPMSKPGIKKTQWITSTRKSATGPMQKLINGITDAIKEGHKPPYKLYTWCVFETAQNVSNCQVANPDLPDCDKCECHTVAKGKWDDGTNRTFEQICKGKFSKSQGYIPIEDVWETFMSSDLDTWEAQQECSKPEVGGMVFKTWSRERYGIKWYEPDPSNGLIFMGVDYSGGAVPNAVTWYQLLRNDILVYGANDEKGKPTKKLKAGTRVAFDEIYKANIGNTELADLVVKRESVWRQKYPDFAVVRRFPDPANKQARHDWAYHQPPLYTVFYCTRDIKEQIKTCKQILRDDKFAIDLTRCTMMQLEFDSYHYPEKKDNLIDDPEIPVDDFNHTMSNFRYTMENLKHIEKKIAIKPGVPGASPTPHQTKSPVKSSSPRYHPISVL